MEEVGLFCLAAGFNGRSLSASQHESFRLSFTLFSQSKTLPNGLKLPVNSSPLPPLSNRRNNYANSFPVHTSLRLLHCAKYNSLERGNLVIWLTLLSLCHNFWTPQQNGFGFRPHSPQRLITHFWFLCCLPHTFPNFLVRTASNMLPMFRQFATLS